MGRLTPETRKPHVRLRTIGIVALCAVVVASCTSNSQDADSGGEGQTLTIGITASVLPSTDTILANNQGFEGVSFVANQIYDALTALRISPHKKPTLIPGLATSWSAKKNATVWTFHLRQGVQFTDGTAFNAHAVVFNIKRYTQPDFKWYYKPVAALAAPVIGPVEKVQAIDDYTVKIVTSRPWAHLPRDLYFIKIASPAAIKKWGNKDYWKHAVGTGPFKVKKIVRGEKLVMVKNSDYWGGPPKLEKLVIKPIPDDSARVAALKSGAVDWIEGVRPNDIRNLKSAGFNIEMNSYGNFWFWYLDVTRPPFNDVRVRRALNYAVNRDAITQQLLNGTASSLGQIAPKANLAHVPGIGYEYNPEKAKALLKEAGYADGLTIDLYYPTNGSGMISPSLMNQTIAQQLSKVGIKVDLHPKQFNVISKYLVGGMPKQAEAVNFSASFLIEAVWTGLFSTGGAYNIGGYSNPKVDALLKKANTQVDAETRYQTLAQVNKVLTRDAPILMVASSKGPRALAPYVKGFEAPMCWFVDLTEVYIQKS